ncbi:MAG: DUF3137 domain-containing protein [Litorimonas sp.]
MHQFDEHHKEFKGFSGFYDSEILPALELQEAARLDVIAKIKKVVPAIGAGTILALAIAIYFRAPFMAYAIITGFGVVTGFGGAQYMMRDVKSGTKENIVGGICRYLGWTFSEKTEEPATLEIFKTLGLITKSYTRSNFEDRISGEAHGAVFEFCEGHLEREEGSGKNRKWVTKFRGQILSIAFDQKFLGRTVVLRDGGWFNRKKKGDMKRVGLVDPVFEKIFEAYGTDQVEARYLLTPTFMQRLVDLEHSVDGKNIRFGFQGGNLLIAVETANRYEPGSMFKPLIETSRTQNILDEIGAIYDVIDGVMKR